MTMLTLLVSQLNMASSLNFVALELLAQDGVSRVKTASGMGLAIDIVIVLLCVCGALFGICRSALRR